MMPDADRILKRVPSLAAFVRASWPLVEPEQELLWGWHIQAICEHLEAVADGRIRRLVINAPPAHMSSLLVSVFWPAWMWIRTPGWRAMFSSYSGNVALRDARRAAEVLRGHGQLPWTPSAADRLMENGSGGLRLSVGVGAETAGFRAHAIVADAPVGPRDYEDAAARIAAAEWFEAQHYRVANIRTAAHVIVMPRLPGIPGEPDPAGRALNIGYEALELPLEYDPYADGGVTAIGWNDPRWYAGQLLLPSYCGRAAADKARADVGERQWKALYQQDPS